MGAISPEAYARSQAQKRQRYAENADVRAAAKARAKTWAMANPDKVRAARAKWKREHRAYRNLTARAQNAVANAIKSGRLTRQPCEVCGAGLAEAHHDDYAKPLEVRWLCRPHHEGVHHHR